MTEVDHQQNRLQGEAIQPEPTPWRDRRGEPDDAGYFWIDSNEDDGPDYQWQDVANREGAQRLNLGDNGNSGELDLGFEFPWYGEWYETVRVCTNGWFSFDPEQDGVFAQMPEFPNDDAPNNILAVDLQDFQLQNQGSMYYWTDREGVAVISWISMMTQNGPGVRQNITFQAVLTAETATVLFQYGIQMGLQADQVNVGYENQDGTLGSNYLYHQAGIAEGLAVAITGPFSKWLVIEPRSGQIEANSAVDLELSFIPGDLEAGTYETLVGVTGIARADQDDADTSNTEVSFVMTVDSPTYNITGSVIEEFDQDPIAGATVSLDYFAIARSTDEEGRFEFTDLPEGEYRLNVTARDYLPGSGEAQLAGGDAEAVISLLQAQFTLDPEFISEELPLNGNERISILGSNSGNGPLTYSIDRRLPGDANAEPWELRRVYNVAEALDDDRIEGVAFDGERFYLSGANGENPNTIYVTDREGEPLNSFIQPGESRYGMKDLEYDGELLWGSGEQRVFGFDTEGRIEHEFQGPFNPNINIAYDSDRDLLWLAGTTSNIVAYTKDGQATGASLNRRGLRMYGLAYWPDDPDGYPLYVLNSPAAGVMVIHKFDPETGDTMLARVLDPPDGASPTGLFITNTFDVYSWVIMVANNIPPENGGDRDLIYQLDARKDWFEIEPTEGVIEAGGRQEFELLLDATDLPAAEFVGEIVFMHDGVGQETILPIELDVIAGPVHAERILALSNGWNLVSTNVDPDQPNIVLLMQPLVDQGRLVLMKDGFGRFYLPARQFNNIPAWNVEEGYLIKVNQACELNIIGAVIPPDQPIPLERGWQSIAYYPRDPIDAVTAFSGIVDHLILAKDALGRFYIPARGFSNMGNLREGQGYQVRVDQDVELVYQMGRQRRIAAPMNAPDSPNHFGFAPSSCFNMSVLITCVDGVSLSQGDEVAAGSSSGGLVGAGRVVEDGMVGLAVWGDDPFTESKDGLVDGEKFSLKLWDGGKARETLIDASESPQRGGLVYKTDALVVIDAVSADPKPELHYLLGSYPNPFNSVIKITYQLPLSARVSIDIFDLSGKEVAQLVDRNVLRGYHSVVWDAKGLASGVYLLQVRTPGYRQTQKIALVR